MKTIYKNQGLDSTEPSKAKGQYIAPMDVCKLGLASCMSQP